MPGRFLFSWMSGDCGCPLVLPLHVPAVLMKTNNDTAGQPPTTPDFGLVTGSRLLEIIFPDADSRPSLRSLARYVKRRRVPSIKLGAFRFFSPADVRRSLLEQQLATRGGRR